MTRPLAGTVVLDLTRFLSGPYCTLLLAGMGAQVIKVDDPALGDPVAKAPPFVGPHGVSLERKSGADYGIAYLKRARGKRSVTLDLKCAEGRSLLARLAAKADVVVENFRPGVAARLGADYATLARDNPRLVHCSLSGYGATGPDCDLKAYDLMAQAASGLMGISGEPDGPPVKASSAISDCISGAYSALGIIAALHERNRSGRGQAVDVAMVDCLVSMILDEPLDCYAQLGLVPRQGNRIMRFSPFNAYRTRDGWIVIGCATHEEWMALLAAMGRADLATDPNMLDVGWRIANNAAVDRLVSDWAAGFETAVLLLTLQQADVACSPVRSPGDLMAWEHLQARGMLRTLARPDGMPANVAAAGFPLKFSRSEAQHDAPAPVPGADTEAVLGQMLGLDPAEVGDLRRRGVV
ncbi:MAG: CoA transferase [Burkholderiales bacterium]|nr:CoA transferase [Burkholderiales bacterium]